MKTELTAIRNRVREIIDRTKRTQNEFEALYSKLEAEIKRFQEQAPKIVTPKYSDGDFVEVAGLRFYKEYMSGGDCHVNPDNCISYYDFDQAQKRAKEIGLHIPTNKQFQQLYDGSHVVFAKEGIYFIDKKTGSSILFNYYGYRNTSDGAIYSVGTGGHYWSESVYNADNGYYLYSRSGYVGPQYNNNRRLGFPVRCVQ